MSENRKNVSGGAAPVGGVVSVLERIGEALTNTGNGDQDNDATTDAVALAKARATVEAMAEAGRNLEVTANSLDYCYGKRPENFAACFQQLRDDAEAFRAIYARFHGRAES